MPKFPFVPRDHRFFELFEASIANAVKAAHVLKELVETWTDIETKAEQIEDLEHVGDSITHEIIEHLNRTFVTPYDREDIAALAHSLDDVVDFINAAVMAMHLYKVGSPTKYAQELATTIVEAATEVEKALHLIHHRPKLKQVFQHCVEINRLENVADTIYRKAMAELFEGSPDLAEVIKWREIYEHMESATDRCEDVANVLEGIALKHG